MISEPEVYQPDVDSDQPNAQKKRKANDTENYQTSTLKMPKVKPQQIE